VNFQIPNLAVESPSVWKLNMPRREQISSSFIKPGLMPAQVYVNSGQGGSLLGGLDVCVITNPNAGYCIVTKDAAKGAYVSFLRYDSADSLTRRAACH
jgi:hypothetical protein